jgi:hypothetical protein
VLFLRNDRNFYVDSSYFKGNLGDLAGCADSGPMFHFVSCKLDVASIPSSVSTNTVDSVFAFTGTFPHTCNLSTVYCEVSPLCPTSAFAATQPFAGTNPMPATDSFTATQPSRTPRPLTLTRSPGRGIALRLPRHQE